MDEDYGCDPTREGADVVIDGTEPQHHDVVAAAIVRGDRVLLCHRHPDRAWYPNVWDLPGGHVGDGEDRMDALARELSEELGIEIDRSRSASVLRHRPEPGTALEVWAIDAWAGEIVNAEPAEHDEIGWFSEADLDRLDLAGPGVATACRRALERGVSAPRDDVWVDPRVETRPSALEGRGLFATGEIAVGEVVIRLGGRLVGTAELEMLIAEANSGPTPRYVDTITVFENRHLVLPSGSAAHFGNHSCDPNTWLTGPYELSADRAILPNEELTVDYGTFSGVDGFTMTCRCGSPRCRGEVTSSDWARPELQARYYGHWAPALQARIDDVLAPDTTSDRLPVKDPAREHPVAEQWRPVLHQIVRRFVSGDYQLAQGVPYVRPVSPDTAAFIERYIAEYGDATLVELTDETWETSVSMWNLHSWQVLVDLRTAEEGRSDMVLLVRVVETTTGYDFEIEMVYVP